MTAAERPWLSVITPVYRGERWLDAALRSIADQADDGVEVLLIDSSPDGQSARIARSYEGRLRLRLFENSPLPSWQTKTNRGVELAEADHICWLHHDDLWLEGRIAAVRRWISEAPDAALHIAGSAIVDESGRRLGVWRCPFAQEGEVGEQLLLERLLVQNFIAAPAPVYRKDAWLAAGGIDEALWYTGDWDIWLKLAAKGAVVHHREVFTAFRVHGASLTVTGSRNAADFEQQMKIVLERHLSRLPQPCRHVERAGLASIKINGALAAASSGRWFAVLPALARLLALGPAGIHRYLRDSRIADRLMPRLRARLAGSF